MCEIGKTFANVNYYNKEMQKGMEDKLFFLDRLPKNDNYVFVDFGCADGTMINALASIFDSEKPSNKTYIGYDISETMIDIAKTNYHGPANADVIFTTNWADVEKKFNPYRKTVLILSSVIHEVYSYANDENDITTFWNRVLNTGFDYIIIRDMCPSEDIDRKSVGWIEQRIRQLADRDMLNDFENEWGSISNNRNLIHFLLKYRWKVNWNREVHENYFPISTNLLVQQFNDGFNIYYFERFRLPWWEQCWKKDFDIKINDYTHVKAIFTKKKNYEAE
jgi:SAM-dependent methyltransferase